MSYACSTKQQDRLTKGVTLEHSGKVRAYMLTVVNVAQCPNLRLD